MRTFWAVVAVGLATVVAVADDKPADKLAALKAEAKAADEKLSKAFIDLGDTKEGQAKAEELMKEHREQGLKRCATALELAKADPKGMVAFEAAEWVLIEQDSYDSAEAKEAMQLLRENHAASPNIGKVVMAVGRYTPSDAKNGPAAADLVAAVGEKNKDKTVRGQVAAVAAWRAKAKFETAETKKAKDIEELATAAEKAFEAVAKEYGECKLLDFEGKQTIGEAVKAELFELRNLRVGKTAPDIEGEDTDGAKFKLSDYKGKVVLLDFWGDW